ncbi:MAG TPA: cytochrome P450 [Ktedonobacterales bacterium]|nr:cytochrome P450 [Ktedonobacterales bacterium]
MIHGQIGTTQLLNHDEVTVTSYDQGRSVLEDARFTARPAHALALRERLGPPGLDTPQALLAAIFEQLLFAETATHQCLRQVVDGPLAKASARQLPFIQQVVRELVEAALRWGEIDLEAEFARPLAIRTLAHLFGWPDEEVEVEQLAAWAAHLIDVTTGYGIGQALPVVQEMAAAFRALVAAKQAHPADDLASAIATSPALADETERVLLLMTLFAAGTSTSITALVNGLPLLLADPERLSALRAELAAERKTLSHLIDEVLRLVTPTQYVRRWTTTDLRVGDTSVSAGCPVQVTLSAMNKDQECFHTPDALDWQRPRRVEQAAFGFGAHACPGAPLARMELRVALEALLAQPELHLVSEEMHWNNNQNQHRRQGVRVRVTRKEPTHGTAG